MKKITIILSLLVISAVLYSQEERPRNLPAFDYKRLHWGFTVGLNSMDFSFNRNTASADYLHADVIGFQPSGFQVNIVSDLRLSDYWTFRVLPGINLGSRNIIYFDPDTWKEHTRMTVGSSFLDFPMLFKYRSERVNNYRPYLIGGFSYRHDMSARKEYDLDEDDRIRLKRGDLYLELGFGIDSYLQFFKYATEIKLAIGLRNMMTDDPYPGEPYYVTSVNSMRSYMVMINFHFE